MDFHRGVVTRLSMSGNLIHFFPRCFVHVIFVNVLL